MPLPLRARLVAPVNPSEAFRIERVICVARMVLAVTALLSLDVQPSAQSHYAPLARTLLIFFLAHSAAAILVLRSHPRKTAAFSLTTHTIDVVAAAMTLPLASLTNLFFTFFLFVLISAAFRWGFREVVLTAVAAIDLMLLHMCFTSVFPGLSLGSTDDLVHVLVRSSYLVMVGLLFGFVSEEGRLLRSETTAVVSLLHRIRGGVGAPRALMAAASDIASLFNASSLLIVVQDPENRRLFRWDTAIGWSVVRSAASDPRGVDRRSYFFGPSDYALGVTRRRWPLARSRYRIVPIDALGRIADPGDCSIPAAFAAAHPFRRLITAPIAAGDWSGRIFVFEPRVNVRLSALAQLLLTLVQQVSPAVFSVYLQDRLRARTGAIERARVARELHDGVIQSLIGVEMQLEVLRGTAPLLGTPSAVEVTRLQGMVRDEVLNLRELMQQLRPVEFDPEDLLDHLADMVQRFGRDSGIASHFLTELKDVRLDRHVCFELARIVQEGLVNIRKHSAAAHVVVRFAAHDGHWALEIDDDGRGFPFEGRLSQSDLDARRTGPTVIKERVRAIGGQLFINSTPGRGARLEVLVPQEAHG